ncbi:hypothetical protein [Nocardia huaxiensis]|uniref:Low molecular weight antigen MTB12-like C-terminal domain-containing protein n=1 Tax=Nocardia huaxiensis TaxID=2755382 RepID=A0A7D6ZH83_9NOCA|nr:hypothetical protein [Nocardia huaxiensis]QLY33638.1 hypothetical protein H0264_16630 [Nocardia huaxiensis]UFS99446.1 hypothetical protein LPY97_16895 [Nocardia huaxiensis]
MKLQKTGRIAVATLAIVTALGLSACGEGDKKETKPKATTSKTTAATAPQGNLPAVPTAADLNAELQKALDPNVPNDQKLDMMQGVSADPTLPQRLTEAYQQNNATITVTGVTDLGNGTITADADASINGGQPQKMVVPFVAEDGKWKVQKEWICNTLSLANQTSPACA